MITRVVLWPDLKVTELSTVPSRPSVAGKCPLAVNTGRRKLDTGVRGMHSGMFYHKDDTGLVKTQTCKQTHSTRA